MWSPTGCRGDSSREEAGPQLWIGKFPEAERAFTGGAQRQRLHGDEPRGKQPELGWWPVGSCSMTEPLENRTSEGEGV